MVYFVVVLPNTISMVGCATKPPLLIAAGKNVAHHCTSGGSIQDGNGCHQRIVYSYSNGHPYLPGLCSALPLHLCCYETNYGATETAHAASTPPIYVSTLAPKAFM